MKHTSPERLYGIEIALPPFPEQLKIAEILSTWDEAIEKTSRLIECRERQRLALTHQLVFGQRQLGDFAVNSLPTVTPFSRPIATPLGVVDLAYPRSA